MKIPNRQDLNHALASACAAHREYEENYLHRVRDENRAGWLAAFLIGRLGTFATPTKLAGWLAATPNSIESWIDSATDHILAQYDSGSQKRL